MLEHSLEALDNVSSAVLVTESKVNSDLSIYVPRAVSPRYILVTKDVQFSTFQNCQLPNFAKANLCPQASQP